MKVEVEKGGLCGRRWKEWQNKVVTKNLYTIDVNDFAISWKQEVARVFINMESQAKNIAQVHFDNAIKQASSLFQAYSQLLLDAANSAERTHKRGEKAIKERLVVVWAHLHLIDAMQQKLGTIKKEIQTKLSQEYSLPSTAGVSPGTSPSTSLYILFSLA